MNNRTAKNLGLPTVQAPRVPVRAERFAMHLRVKFREPRGSAWFEGVTENVSESGILFRSGRTLKLGTEIEMRLELPAVMRRQIPGAIICLARVVRFEFSRVPADQAAVAVALKGYRIARGDKAPRGSWMRGMLPADPD